MIKSYLQLNNEEKGKVDDFIRNNKITYESLEEFNDEVKGKICNYGEGILFYLDNNEIKGKISVILEVAKELNTVYLNKLICPYENQKILQELINAGKELAKKYDGNKILLGIRDEKLLESSKKMGLLKSYSSYNMILEKKDNLYSILNKVRLSNNNINKYVEIFNKSFMDMPHGTFITIEDATGYLENQNKEEEYFMVTTNNSDNIGFVNINIKDNKGFFDIGLIKEYRGRGYGKKILETAIDYLSGKGIEDICLTVIEKNTVAFEMYKKRGFKIYKKLSDWIEIY